MDFIWCLIGSVMLITLIPRPIEVQSHNYPALKLLFSSFSYQVLMILSYYRTIISDYYKVVLQFVTDKLTHITWLTFGLTIGKYHELVFMRFISQQTSLGGHPVSTKELYRKAQQHQGLWGNIQDLDDKKNLGKPHVRRGKRRLS